MYMMWFNLNNQACASDLYLRRRLQPKSEGFQALASSWSNVAILQYAVVAEFAGQGLRECFAAAHMLHA